jgi:hypothetical protein
MLNAHLDQLPGEVLTFHSDDMVDLNDLGHGEMSQWPVALVISALLCDCTAFRMSMVATGLGCDTCRLNDTSYVPCLLKRTGRGCSGRWSRLARLPPGILLLSVRTMITI